MSVAMQWERVGAEDLGRWTDGERYGTLTYDETAIRPAATPRVVVLLAIARPRAVSVE